MGNGLPTVEDVADGCKQDASAARSSFPQLTTPQYNKLEGICWAIAKKYYPRFRNHPATSLDDLFQTALTGAHSTLGGAIKAHHEFDPARGSYSVWIGKRASAAILDHLKRSNRHNAQDKAGEISQTRIQSEHAKPERIPEMKKIPKKLSERGRTGHGGDAYARAFAWGAEQGLNMRQTWLRLRFDTKTWLRMGFRQYPAWSSFAEARQRLIKWSEKNA